MLDLGLDGVHVCVTGSNGGIGLPTIKLFLDQGAYVTALYNSSRSEIDVDPDILQHEASDIPRLSCISVDVTAETSVERFFANGIKNDWPTLSILVVNHGIFVAQDCPIWDMSLAQFERTLKVNTVGPFLLIRSFLKTYKTKLDDAQSTTDLYPPTIVLVGSTAAEFGEANHSDYATSKSGLTHGMMKSVKNEIVKIHPRGRINTVAPGWVGTKMAEESLKDERTRFMAMATTPMKKIATPEEVATQIVLLSSEKVSSHTTGEITMLAGGMEGRLLNPK